MGIEKRQSSHGTAQRPNAKSTGGDSAVVRSSSGLALTGAETAIDVESVTQVTLDMGEVRIFRGIRVQEGVEEIPYNGPSFFSPTVFPSLFSLRSSLVS